MLAELPLRAPPAAALPLPPAAAQFTGKFKPEFLKLFRLGVRFALNLFRDSESLKIVVFQQF
jgi:hypothetical protein